MARKHKPRRPTTCKEMANNQVIIQRLQKEEGDPKSKGREPPIKGSSEAYKHLLAGLWAHVE